MASELNKTKSLRFSSSAKDLKGGQGDEDDEKKGKGIAMTRNARNDEKGREKGKGSIMELMGAKVAKKMPKTKPQPEHKVAKKKPQQEKDEEQHGDNVELHDNDDNAVKSAKKTLDCQDIPQEMQEALASLQYKGQPWFNQLHVYVITFMILLALCLLCSLLPARDVETIVTMAPTMDLATSRLALGAPPPSPLLSLAAAAAAGDDAVFHRSL